MNNDAPDEGLTEASAHRALLAACGRAGLRPDGAELIRLGENAMFLLPAQAIVVRIARSADLADKVRREVEAAHWLSALDFPGARVLNDVEQPVEADGRLATFWEYVPRSTAVPGTGDLADLLRRFHELPRPDFDVPRLDPFPVMRRRLASAHSIKAADVRFLDESCALSEEPFRAVMARSERGVIHGDAHRGNVLMRRTVSLLIDYEAIAEGPAAWDLVPTAMAVDRFGLSHAEYREFADVYGSDVTGWDGYAVLRTVRELGMTTWLMQNAHEGTAAAEEFARRMESLRKADLERRWYAL